MLQVLKRHFSRYVPELVPDTFGGLEEFRSIAHSVVDNSGRTATTSFVCPVGWTQHSLGAQFIRTASILPMPVAGVHDTFSAHLDAVNPPGIRGYWGAAEAYVVNLLTAWWGESARADNDWASGGRARAARAWAAASSPAAGGLHGGAALEHGDPDLARDLPQAALRLRRVGIEGEPLQQGRAGRFIRLSKIASVAGAGLTLLDGKSRAAAVRGGLALDAGSALLRFGVFEEGMESAKDPRCTVVPQRERLEARRAERAARRQRELDGDDASSTAVP